MWNCLWGHALKKSPGIIHIYLIQISCSKLQRKSRFSRSFFSARNFASKKHAYGNGAYALICYLLAKRKKNRAHRKWALGHTVFNRRNAYQKGWLLVRGRNYMFKCTPTSGPSRIIDFLSRWPLNQGSNVDHLQ